MGNLSAMAKMLAGRTIGSYDQNKDLGLLKLGASRDGACLALCLRWLGCRSLKQDFWATTFSASNTLKDPASLDQVMQRFSTPGSEKRQSLLEAMTKNLGLSAYAGETASGMKWKSGFLTDGSVDNLVTEVFDADCHGLVGLGKGSTYTASKGDGHAVAFITPGEQGKARHLFDPNFGEFAFDTEHALDSFMSMYWWSEGRYNKMYKSFKIDRFGFK